VVDFNVQYASWGSYASFILGRFGGGGGFALSDVHSPSQNIHIGYWNDGSPVRILPFFIPERVDSGRERYSTEFVATGKNGVPIASFAASSIDRKISWATDRFAAENLVLRIHTPFMNVPHLDEMGYEDKRLYLCPVVIAELELDNSGSSLPMHGFFAMSGVNRTFSEGSRSGPGEGEEFAGKLCGSGQNGRWGFAARPSAGMREHIGWDFLKGVYSGISGRDGFHRLGNEGGLVVDLAPGERRTIRLALGTYQDGIVTTGIESRLYYTTCFRNLEDVLDFALDRAETYLEKALERDKELDSSDLNPERKFLLAHATRSYLASTELLLTRKGEPLFVVNEGEYRMMNTLDLTVDQAFWEMQFSPWTVRNELDFHLRYSSYRDRYGLCFSHDQGAGNAFAPAHTSAYEISEISDCFSYMTFEEILNWTLTAALYVELSGDGDWLKEKAPVIEDLLSSILARDSNGDGLMDLDSDRCGSGAEITTYDSLDVSLGQARGNLYIGMKTWAACLGLACLMKKLKDPEKARSAEKAAERCAAAILSHFDRAKGYVPAVFENGNESRIIPAIEALVYPWFWGDGKSFALGGTYAKLGEVLGIHLGTVMKRGVCLDPKSGGWKLSSTSNNTWLSKIMLNEYVAETILGFETGEWEAWDAVHASWMRGGSADFAATDQVDSATGKDLGSRLYPRLVTSILWLRYANKGT
jgi:xylan 1,4-beta-xylosidase